MGNCGAIRPLVRDVVAQMSIPLIQGSIRYAQICARQGADALANPEKAMAERTAFAASIIPRIAACPDGGAEDAEVLWSSMKHGAPLGDADTYRLVKSTFEKYYSCLNITCEEVGGFYDNRAGGGDYYPDSNPCTPPPPPGGALLNNEAIIGVVIGGGVALIFCLLACCCIIRLVREEKKGKPIFTSLTDPAKPGMQA